MRRGDGADGGDEALAEWRPLVLAPGKHWLVNQLQHGQFRIECGQSLRQFRPELHKRRLPPRIQLRFTILVVNVHDHQQARALQAGDGGIEERQTVGQRFAGRGVHDELGRDAEADVLQTDRRDERGFGVAEVIAEVRGGFAARMAEPATDVRTGGQARETGGWHRGLIRGLGRQAGQQQCAGGQRGGLQKSATGEKGLRAHT